MKRKKGFTLIEILIVVVILGILASMILPRLLSQTERANIAEAQQMLGAIRTAQTRTQDLSGAAGYTLITSCPIAAACTAAEWTAIGMTAPTTNRGLYDYACAAAGTACTATRNATPANIITLNQDGTWGCAGAYVATNPARGGCQ